MKQKALKRDDRKRQIMLAFAVELQAGRNARMTVADIAHKVQLAVSTKLRKMVNELVKEGLLSTKTEEIPGCVGFRVIYTPTAVFDGRGGKEREPRTVVFRAKQNGQQAMWTEVLT